MRARPRARTPSGRPSSVLRFGVFELDVESRELRKAGMRVKVRPQALTALALLASHPSQLVTREEMQQQIWGNETFVDFQQGLNLCIKEVRTALGDEALAPRYIETVHRRGYRFVAPVEVFDRTDIAWNDGRSHGKFPAKQITLAVLPFGNLSEDPSEQHFADGMTDALTTNLAQISALQVIARTSATQYKETQRLVPKTARKLNVDVLVGGSVLRSGQRVRIAAELIDAKTNYHLWAQSYERELRDVLALQREVAQAIAREIRDRLTAQEQPQLRDRPAVDPQAYTAYLKGRYHWNKMTDKDLRKGIEYFEQAIQSEPSYGPAYAGLADSYILLGYSGADQPDVAHIRAKAAAMEGIKIDEMRAEAYSSLADIRFIYEWNWLDAEMEYKRSIELSPSYGTAHQWYSGFLAAGGRFDEAIDHAKRAVELDPLSLVINAGLGCAHYFAGRYDDATLQLQKTLEMDPNFVVGCLTLGQVYEQRGMLGDAIAEFHKAVAFSEGSSVTLAALGHAYALSGKRVKAVKILNKLKALSDQKYVSSYGIALVCVGLGEKNQALKWLQKAFEQHCAELVHIKVDPRLESLSSDPRLVALEERMQFPR